MWWYKAYYGSWREPKGVQMIDFGKYCYGTYNRNDAFSKAQETANRERRTVTVSAERGSCNGIVSKYYEFKPLDSHDTLNQRGVTPI
jgi:hypothetical protein